MIQALGAALGGGHGLALALSALAMLALRAAGLLVAGALRPDHPLVAWAAAVSQATLAAFVALAVAAPGGAAAAVPWPAGWPGWRWGCWPSERRAGGCCRRCWRGSPRWRWSVRCCEAGGLFRDPGRRAGTRAILPARLRPGWGRAVIAGPPPGLQRNGVRNRTPFR
jgi:hypothetical protein